MQLRIVALKYLYVVWTGARCRPRIHRAPRLYTLLHAATRFCTLLQACILVSRLVTGLCPGLLQACIPACYTLVSQRVTRLYPSLFSNSTSSGPARRCEGRVLFSAVWTLALRGPGGDGGGPDDAEEHVEVGVVVVLRVAAAVRLHLRQQLPTQCTYAVKQGHCVKQTCRCPSYEL